MCPRAPAVSQMRRPLALAISRTLALDPGFMGWGIQRMDGEGGQRGRVTTQGHPALLEHQRLLPLQFLRNSLKKTRGSNWSLRLSKELNNQIESFDSPSLEKVGPHGGRARQR